MMLGSGSWDVGVRSFLLVTLPVVFPFGDSKRIDFRFARKWMRRFCSISGINNANHQSTGSQRPHFGSREEQEPGLAGLPAASRRVHPCVHHDAEEAELGTP
jgi:hypothetical protein